MLKLRDRQDEMNKAILAIRDLRTQLQSLEKRLGSDERDENRWSLHRPICAKKSAPSKRN